jgi:hypothetical protein
MKETINFNQFLEAFTRRERQNQFSYEGKRALFDYLEQYEEETGEEIELDIVALCCEYTEYESLKELQENYTDIKDMEDLRDRTQVIEIEGKEGFIIQDF